MKIVRSSNGCEYCIHYPNGATMHVTSDVPAIALKLLQALLEPPNTQSPTLVAIVRNIAVVRRLEPNKQYTDFISLLLR